MDFLRFWILSEGDFEIREFFEFLDVLLSEIFLFKLLDSSSVFPFGLGTFEGDPCSPIGEEVTLFFNINILFLISLYSYLLSYPLDSFLTGLAGKETWSSVWDWLIFIL